MNKIKEYFKNRFSKFALHNYIVLGVIVIILILGLQFSIGMSISASKGLTLFGNESNSRNEIEINGPTSADIRVITIFWILTSLVFAFLIFYAFFYKLPEKEAKPKEIIDRKVVYSDEVEEDKNNQEQDKNNNKDKNE